MIEVNELTKRYGDTTAVRRLNTVDPRELPGRLSGAGFTSVSVAVHPKSGVLRFRGTHP
ncbi:hypothetical protein [Streptomyces sp. NPDC005251]|uniref:hypothetical protein n=1 Tax=unclassified Streptomyces TaxID=2593676 RepID=UPI0033B8EBE8